MCFPQEDQITTTAISDYDELCVANTFISVKNPSSCSKKRSSSAPPQVNLDRPKVEIENGHVTHLDRIAATTLVQMECIMLARGCATMKWFRIVHSGYGKPLWFQLVEATKRPLVGSRSKAEGCFVAVLPGETIDEVVDEMIAINLQVRRLSRFQSMKRANKSRVQFKSEPMWTALTDGGVLVTSMPPVV
jgi:hypothetical protein